MKYEIEESLKNTIREILIHAKNTGHSCVEITNLANALSSLPQIKEVECKKTKNQK